MATTIRTLEKLRPNSTVNNRFGNYANLDVNFEENTGIVWKYIKKDAPPHFSHQLLDDIRSVQSQIRRQTAAESGARLESRIKYVVFGSRIPGIFSLGGDLRLFSKLIAAQDRAALAKYSRKATDSIFFHSSNSGSTLSISLVQGAAMGGGFEAALAGNVLVAERGTKLGFPEVLFGLFPGMGAYTLLRRRVSASTAEEIILSATNYTAERLHEMGVVDILCDAGDGVEAVRSYVSRHASRPGVAAFRRALNQTHAIDRRELYSLADAWVEAAMNLDPRYQKRIERLIANQDRNFPLSEKELYLVPLAGAR